MTEYRVLDLFAGLGGFSQAFAASERWAVTTVEIEGRFEPDVQADVFELRPSDFETEFDVVLASPPCTQFSTAGNHDAWDFDTHEPQTDAARDAIGLVYHTLGLIRGLAPRYWFLENPQGRLRWFLGRPTGKVTYCQYGRPYMKRTDLWGDHPPMTYHSCPSLGNSGRSYWCTRCCQPFAKGDAVEREPKDESARRPTRGLAAKLDAADPDEVSR